jgi:hypothetical protein
MVLSFRAFDELHIGLFALTNTKNGTLLLIVQMGNIVNKLCYYM